MGILNLLKRMVTGTDDNIIDNNEVEDDKKRCLIEVKLTQHQFDLAALYYYNGSTSYRSFFKYVFLYNINKINDIFDIAEKKANSGCLIDSTVVRLKYNNKHYIDIPFEIFSNMRDVPENVIKIKPWHRANIKRLLVNDPNLSMFDEEAVSEAIKNVVLEHLRG